MQNVAHWLENSTLGSDVFQYPSRFSRRYRKGNALLLTQIGHSRWPPFVQGCSSSGAPLWGVRFRNRLFIMEHHLRFEMQFCDISEKAAT